MKTLSRERYEAGARTAEVVAADERGAQVVRLPGGEFAKLFRRKRRISSAAWSPYARRFERAARMLQSLGVPTVDVVDSFHVDSGLDIVVYRPLPGELLRDALATPGRPSELLPRFADFLAELHGLGVYFRGIHLANVLVLEDGGFGLIDVGGARCGRALGLTTRVRNFKPLVRHPSDRGVIEGFGGRAFLERYAEASGLGPLRRTLLVATVARRHPTFSR